MDTQQYNDDNPTAERPTEFAESNSDDIGDHSSNEHADVIDVLGNNDQELARRHFYDNNDQNLFGSDACKSRQARAAATNARDSNDRYDEDDLRKTADVNSNHDYDATCNTSPSHPSQYSNVVDDEIGHCAKINDKLIENMQHYPRTINDNHANNNRKRCNSISDNEDQSPSEHAHSNASTSNKHHPDEPEQMRKLFIGGLDYKTSEDTLRQHFEKFGEVTDCVVMRESSSKRSRGFGFVIYASQTMVDKAQLARPHEVDGREVQSKRAISREDSRTPEARATVKKVYLGGLSDDIEESELRGYFKEFGTILNINIIVDKNTGKRRGFAYIEYDDYDPVDKIVLQQYHTIKGKRMEAKKAFPPVVMDGRRRGDPRVMSGAMLPMPGSIEGGGMVGHGGRHRSSRGGGGYHWDQGPHHPSAAMYPVANYSNQSAYGYPPNYHGPGNHYNNWLMHGSGATAAGNQAGAFAGGSGIYGFRGTHGGGPVGGAYTRNGYASGPTAAAAAANWPAAADYSCYANPPGAGAGGAGPLRLGYQHRGWSPYGSGGGGHGGAHRGRGYN